MPTPPIAFTADPATVRRHIDARFVDVDERLLTRLRGVCDDVTTDPALRADIQLVETYRHATVEPLACPITAYAGLEDPIIQRQDLAAWRHYTTGRFTIQTFAGDHFYLNQTPNLLCNSVATELRRAVTKQDVITQ